MPSVLLVAALSTWLLSPHMHMRPLIKHRWLDGPFMSSDDGGDRDDAEQLDGGGSFGEFIPSEGACLAEARKMEIEATIASDEQLAYENPDLFIAEGLPTASEHYKQLAADRGIGSENIVHHHRLWG